MRWTERQRAMLREIGVRVWSREDLPGSAGGVVLADDPTAGGASRPDSARAARDHATPPPRMPSEAGARSIAQPGAARAAAAGDARAAAIAAMDWPSLRASAADCTACALHEGRTRSVFANLAGQADWAVVGDPPGADDDRSGTPLAGSAGVLLDNMLRAVQRSRAETALPPLRVSVTTVVKCRPPADRTASAAEIAACEPYLRRQLQLIRPRVVVAMGRCAAQGVLQRAEPLGPLRGSVHTADGVPVVVTFHPAHLLRHPGDKAKAWEDLCRAVDAASAAPELPASVDGSR